MGLQFGVCTVLAFSMLMCMPRAAETTLLTILKALVSGRFTLVVGH